MKSTKDFRSGGDDFTIKRPQKLDPIRKSGKERHAIFKALDEEDDDELLELHKRESVYDYMDDGDDEEQQEEEDFYTDEVTEPEETISAYQM